MLMISHRGYGAEGNTKAALQNSRTFGFDVLEVDLHKTADKEIVLHHDLFLGPYNIEETNLDVLREKDQYLLTLGEFFQYFPPEQNTIYLDLKGSIELAQLLVDYVNAHKICTTDIIVASFNEDHIQIIKNAGLSWKIGFITNNQFDDKRYEDLLVSVDILVLQWNMLSHKVLDICHQKGKRVFVYTCTTTQIYDYISLFPVDGIVSDIIVY